MAYLDDLEWAFLIILVLAPPPTIPPTKKWYFSFAGFETVFATAKSGHPPQKKYLFFLFTFYDVLEFTATIAVNLNARASCLL